MNIAIIGYGKMGKQIHKFALEKKHSIISIIDKFAPEVNFKTVDSNSLKDVEVVIDFASPEGIEDRINEYVKNNVCVVMGTTGWYNNIDKIKKIVDDKIGFIWSGNFSLGVNIFFRIVKEASKIFNNFPEYDSLAYEIHHNQKQDSPSGTALMIGNVMLSELKNKTKITTEKLDRKIESDELHIASVRAGYYPGTHTVEFDSAVDTIELKHTARTREGFAVGAVMAAGWIKDKKGFFSIDDFMNAIIK
ncbi:MAG: 4-hydroxy-tetrahydrodipicolinate reductase [Spirochaetes bacterium GWC1_27_15]|nr:MAG: 4-hydroxy-tetrahydrodipicolinate reductase [Spirochaetes bacterium GWC1_27_15]